MKETSAAGIPEEDEDELLRQAILMSLHAENTTPMDSQPTVWTSHMAKLLTEPPFYSSTE